MAVAALALEDITVTFASQDGGRYTALRNTTLRIAPGEFVSVVGPTGCGKSTLLNVAVGLLQPSAGRIRVFDEPLAGLNRKAGYLRSEEHTSELQSPCNLVCRLLLEKKKNTNKDINSRRDHK